MILLSTLNRLAGSDILQKKSELMKKLSDHFSIDHLAKILPDNRKSIERLKDISLLDPTIADSNPDFLNPVVFFLDNEQMELVDKAITLAASKESKSIKTNKRAHGLVRISEEYLNEE